jgi:hypothetical protein
VKYPEFRARFLRPKFRMAWPRLRVMFWLEAELRQLLAMPRLSGFDRAGRGGQVVLAASRAMFWVEAEHEFVRDDAGFGVARR